MNENFARLVEKKSNQIPAVSKWQKKITSYFDSFSYINSADLIEEHIGKLTHIGVNSIRASSDLVAAMTSETMNMIDSQLKVIITEISQLTSQFESLEKTLTQKKGFFSKKTSAELFFEKFIIEQENIRIQIRELNLKEHNLFSAKDLLDNNIEKLLETFYMLDRDVSLLKLADEKLSKSSNALVAKFFNKNVMELNSIRIDLMTHQQIIFQKYGGLSILLDNIFNCHKNIKYISQVTHNVLMNIAELQQIMSLSQSTLNNKESEALKKLRETLTLVTTDLRVIAAQPFSLHLA